ncbi:MAG: amidase [Gammaproteobacteria bacterium]|jgi:amidase
MPNLCKFPLDTLADLTATEAAAGIAAEKYTCEALVHACLERILAIEPELHAWAYLDADNALEAAQILDKEPARGPLHGVPFGLKDIIDTVDMPTEHGSPIYHENQPNRDAACVAACRAAGGLVLGKTVTTEFAHRHPGPTRNPWNTDHTPGGSSSGSAAAVGARMVPVAFGTQTTGSTIRPAAYCGTVGYKPSYGDLCLTGVGDNVPTFDTLGLIARSVDDLALFRYAVMGLSQRPLEDVPLKGVTVGFCRTAFWTRTDAATKKLLEDAAARLAAAGATVRDFAMPDGEEGLPDVVRKVSGFEFARVMTYERLNHGDKLSKALLGGRAADGLNCSYEDYRAARATVDAYRQALCTAMEDVDLLLTPSAPGEAPEGITATGDAIFNNVWTTTHVPAVTLPVGKGDTGLPLGVQLIGRLHRDHRLLELAKAVHCRVFDGG